jgi:hypothetical protein
MRLVFRLVSSPGMQSSEIRISLSVTYQQPLGRLQVRIAAPSEVLHRPTHRDVGRKTYPLEGGLPIRHSTVLCISVRRSARA